MLSTVFGVYLAAQSGLEQALKFDTFSKMEDNYYLRTSLYDEVKDNADNLSKFAALLAKSPPSLSLNIISQQSKSIFGKQCNIRPQH